MKKFYAIEYAYGRSVINNGNRADHYTTFATKAERDAWVAAGDAFGGAGSRDAVKAKNVPARYRDDWALNAY